MARHVRIRSFAKINLDLRVLHKRADGYHELRTIFQTISLADTIDITYEPVAPRSGFQVISDIDIPGNLIEKAAELLFPGLGRRAYVTFQLTKNIPMGGGLGGGSSNAAAVLLALPALAGRDISLQDLIGLASQLGSDVPFFLMGGTAVGIGRGTELYPLPDFPGRPAVVVTPDIHVSTAEAYRNLAREESTTGPPSHMLHDFQALAWYSDQADLAGKWLSTNDFEAVVFRQHPQLKSIRGALLNLGASPALMSGSGSSVFGVFRNRPERDDAVASLRTKWKGTKFSNARIFPVTLMTRDRYRSLWRRQLSPHIRPGVWPPASRYRS